ncbi:MAG TPA: STN and carboxypeptidase regulatory-like domain-containing protein [Draconibacterium sp.]|nr:STN and carboxypeptidase regulatory-like domain-containing protein [Draconibacterium sp.]
MLNGKAFIPAIILLFSFVSKGQQQDGSVLENRVTIIQQNQPLSSILNQLSWQAGVYFSYDANLIDADKKYTIDVTDKSLFTVLNQLFDAKKYKFSELQNQVIISNRTAKESRVDAVIDSIPVKYFFLTGKIISKKKEEPIPYASISLFNKPVGTISNSDGDFLLKIHPDNIFDTLIISCMGYAQIITRANKILDEDVIAMEPISIRIKEVKVTATTPEQLLNNIRENISKNYSENSKLMTAFYRETLKEDENYINIAEAVIQILKAPYVNSFRNDVVRMLKGRRSPDVQPFQWLNFKLQGGPFTITQLDVVKTMESFIDKEYQGLYKYNISKVIWYNNNPVYVLQFHPVNNSLFPLFEGEMYVHRETFAIVHASFGFNKAGLSQAQGILIKKKPSGVKVKPTYVHYEVNYQQFQGKWYLYNARSSVKFKVRSKRDKINSEYHSVSDLLITDIQPTDMKRFARNEAFNQHDIFVEMINDYDPKFWENFNIIKPNDDLRNAFKNLPLK